MTEQLLQPPDAQTFKQRLQAGLGEHAVIKVSTDDKRALLRVQVWCRPCRSATIVDFHPQLRRIVDLWHDHTEGSRHQAVINPTTTGKDD